MDVQYCNGFVTYSTVCLDRYFNEFDLSHFVCFTVTGYYVEKRERGGEWLRANNYPTTNLNFTVHDLREGGKYEFRVIAINEAGPGKPSKPTDIVQCKEQKSKCNDNGLTY
jgi:Fibronectin type III domain.